jgi:hypothetical protein
MARQSKVVTLSVCKEGFRTAAGTRVPGTSRAKKLVGPQPKTVDSRSYVKVVKEGSMNRDLGMSTPDGTHD